MKFKPFLLPTGIGSLPHLDPYEASNLILHHFPESPYWPQLPLRNQKEGMLFQFTEGMPGLVFDDERIYFRKPFNPNTDWEKFYEVYFNEDLNYFKITNEYASGFYAMLNLLKNRKPKILKGQVTGPITLGLGLSDENKIPIFYDSNLKEMLLRTISSKAKWQEMEFKKVVPEAETLIFFDEPILSSYGSISMNIGKEEIIESIKKTISSLQGLSGIHICGATDWSIIMETGINVIHFDAYRFFSNMTAYIEELKRFLLNGGLIAWGIVPSEEEFIKEENLENLIKIFEDKINLLIREGIPDTLIFENSFISQSCGLSSLSEELAKKALNLSSLLSQKIKENLSIS
jgi:methionine synthase II (cobalamin-independent)